MHLIDQLVAFEENADGLYVRRSQEIPQEFLDSLANERAAKQHVGNLEFHRVASIPVSVVEIWLRQGRDFYNATTREIAGWLRRDGLEAFLATDKAV